jgi:anti-sigma factor RsiW
MSACDPQLLSVYLDGELPADRREQLELHLRDCPECRAQLQMLRDNARAIQQHPFDDLRDDELTRLHQAIDAEQEDHPVWRLGLILGALAASVMIISSAWLMELPARRTVHPQEEVSMQPMESWERVAMYLRADPLAVPADDQGAIRLADSQFAQWMLDGLANQP